MEEQLTKREKEILLGIKMGYTNRQMAAMLVVSDETIKSHVHHLHQKMGSEFPKRHKKTLARAFAVTSDGHPLFGVQIVEK